MNTIPPMAIVKNAGYVIVLVGSIEWLGFDPQSIGIFVGLMILDVISGIARAILVVGGPSIKSSVLSKGVIAKLLLLAVPLTAALALKGVGFPPQVLAQGVVNVLILSEAYSVLGNIHSALTREPKSEFDAVAAVLSMIKRMLDSTLNRGVPTE